MTEAYAVKFDPEAGLFRISGELSLDTVTAVMKETATLFEKQGSIDVDLTEVTRSDSAGLALLVAWMREAQQAEKAISFRHLPAQMLAIANATGLDDFLPLQ